MCGNTSSATSGVQAAIATAKSLNLELQQVSVRIAEDFDGAFAAMTKGRVDAIALTEDGVVIANARRIAGR
jgi:hypothetical protein